MKRLNCRRCSMEFLVSQFRESGQNIIIVFLLVKHRSVESTITGSFFVKFLFILKSELLFICVTSPSGKVRFAIFPIWVQTLSQRQNKSDNLLI